MARPNNLTSFLDTMAASIYAGFKDKLRKGQIRRMGASGGLDGHGRPIALSPILHAMQGFEDNYSDYTRAQAGIPSTSVKVCIFSASIKPYIKPEKGMMVRIDYPAANGRAATSKWFTLLERISTDPAEALWICEAQVSKEP